MFEPILASCEQCGFRYGHPGPCPHCVPIGGPNLNAAMLFAANVAHNMQFRKGRSQSTRKNGPNYIVHCAEIISQLWTWGWECDRHTLVFQLAWLHDAIEEQPTQKRMEIYHQISTTPGLGSGLARLCLQMTHDLDIDKPTYLSTFLDPSATDVESLIVKISDRLQNTRNFMVADRDRNPNKPYAPKYLTKGNMIFDAMEQRRNQIVELASRAIPAGLASSEERQAYGILVYGRMQESYETLQRELGLK